VFLSHLLQRFHNMSEIVLKNEQLYSVDGRRVLGECKRCGVCCSVYESGFPCRHLLIEEVDNKPRATCNSKTLYGGYFARMMACVAYPLPDDVLPTCGFYYEDEK